MTGYFFEVAVNLKYKILFLQTIENLHWQSIPAK